MYLILQQDKPEDYVIATGITTEIREFVKKSFNFMGIGIEFKGENENEVGYISSLNDDLINQYELNKDSLQIGKEIIAVDKRYYRPTEVELLIGDPTKSKTKLNWQPKYNLDSLIEDMMISDIKLMKKDEYLKQGGFRPLSYFE